MGSNRFIIAMRSCTHCGRDDRSRGPRNRLGESNRTAPAFFSHELRRITCLLHRNTRRSAAETALDGLGVKGRDDVERAEEDQPWGQQGKK